MKAMQPHAYAHEQKGPDQSAYACEATALLQALAAVTAARPHHRTVILTDSKSALTSYRNTASPERARLWACARSYAARTPNLELHWVPAHGRHPDWQPPPQLEASAARALNAAADHAAAAALSGSPLVEQHARWEARGRNALAWQRAALSLAATAAQRLAAHLGTPPDGGDSAP